MLALVVLVPGTLLKPAALTEEQELLKYELPVSLMLAAMISRHDVVDMPRPDEPLASNVAFGKYTTPVIVKVSLPDSVTVPVVLPARAMPAMPPVLAAADVLGAESVIANVFCPVNVPAVMMVTPDPLDEVLPEKLTLPLNKYSPGFQVNV